TATPTPERITLTGTFGLSPEMAQKFMGALAHIRRSEDGQNFLVTAKMRDPQTGEFVPVEFVLVPGSFSDNPDIKNPLVPNTVKVTDKNGAEHTLIWNSKEFRVAYDLEPIYTGVNTDNPQFNPEAYQNRPTLTVEDVQSGFAVQQMLLEIQRQMNEGQSLADILYIDPEATRDSWQKLGGNSLLFRLLEDGKIVKLKAKGNDMPDETLRYDNITMKILPFGANVEINGQNYFAFYLANFDPFDPQNPDPNDLANWKFFLSIPSYGGHPIELYGSNSPIGFGDAFKHKASLLPYILLYADEAYRANHPLLSQLLAIKGNDIRQLENPVTPGITFDYWFSWGLNEITQNGTGVAEIYDPNNPNFLPYKIQTMGPFPFEVGVAR
ncbi:MAG: hypothetical protein N2117_07260, partial [Anaerolineales bacterium]|nr:hypothetical protein [Anaerolineales bacterium]